MIANEIEGILKITDASFVAEIVCGAILIVFVLAVVFSLRSKLASFVAYTPALLTTLGIFGTFAGIVIGLMLFDVSKIDESIEGLLGGLKTAFVTSLFGIFASILFKGLQSLGVITPKTSLEQVASATPEDILSAITNQNKALDTLVIAIGGEGDSSLVSQVKLLRGDVNDNQKLLLKSSNTAQEHLGKIESQLTAQQENFTAFSDKLWIKMQDFADMLSKSATETVIEALKQVITDFNKNLTEQFGENFKQLNEAVKELVVWQDNYKIQISDMVAQYKLGVESISATETSVAAISSESQAIPKTMNDLKEVMTVNQHQLSELEKHLEAFKDIRDRAVEAVPEIRKQIQETVDTITDSVSTANKHYENLLTETDKYIEKTTGSIADSVSTANKQIVDSVAEANKHYETLISESDTYIQAHIAKSNELLDKFVKNTSEGVDTIGEKLAESASKVEKVITEGATGFSESVHGVNAGLTSTSNHVSEQSEVISTQLKLASAEMSENVRDMVNGLIEESKAIATTLVSANKDLAKDTGTVRDVVVENIEAMQKRLESSLDSVFSAQTQQMNNVFTNLDKGLKEQVGKTGDAVEKQLDMIDHSMQQELNRSMKLLGDNLGAITTKFTSDYKQLVAQMETVIRTAA